MIKVTRLDQTDAYLNPHNIESIESNPDTLVTMVNGKKIIIRDNLEDIIKRFTKYQQIIHKPSVEIKKQEDQL